MRRGATLTVIGSCWGDNCYDTGPPPDGEGTLSVPIKDIEILVSQADEVVVARGSADADHAFEVDVTIPAGLIPGPVEVIARGKAGLAVSATEEPLVVSSQPAVTQTAQVVSTFGPVTTPAKEDDSNRWAAMAAVVVAALAIAGVGLVIRARRRIAD